MEIDDVEIHQMSFVESWFPWAASGDRHDAANEQHLAQSASGEAECWFLTAPGLSCVDACGSKPATNIATLLQRASSPEVVQALAALEPEVSTSAVHLGQPCGRATSADDGPTYWLSWLNPFRSSSWRAIYLYLPVAGSWDCYDGMSHFDIGDVYRSPCLCQPPPPARLLPAALSGVAIGLALALGLLVPCAYPHPGPSTLPQL